MLCRLRANFEWRWSLKLDSLPLDRMAVVAAGCLRSEQLRSSENGLSWLRPLYMSQPRPSSLSYGDPAVQLAAPGAAISGRASRNRGVIVVESGYGASKPVQ
jgi:hypothetical protein